MGKTYRQEGFKPTKKYKRTKKVKKTEHSAAKEKESKDEEYIWDDYEGASDFERFSGRRKR